MARDTNTRTDQSTSSQASSATAAGATSDRERSIRTDREGAARGGVSRRATTSPARQASANPLVAMRRMADDMDRLFDSLGFGLGRGALGLSPFAGADLLRDPWRGSSAAEQAAWTPTVETFRRGDKLVVRADLPGLDKDDVQVEVDDGMLTISGERSEENVDDRDDYYRSERSYGQFYRAIPIPEGVDGEKCEASFKDGVLEVTFDAPREQNRKARRVEIR